MTKDRASRIGKIEWFDITTDNAEQQRDFYSSVVGWQPTDISMGDYNDFCMQTSDGTTVAGICHARGSNANMPAQWVVYLNVDDIEASVAKVKPLGGEQLCEIRVVGGSGRFCLIRDPAGAVCALFEPSKSET